tara:strand:+ start:108 stop:632 length:525 start_codon:yes stop_codon:yes gene_type:complete
MYIKFLFLLVFCILTSCVNKIQDIDLLYSDLSIDDYGLDLEIDYYLKGKLEFKLIAPEMKKVLEPIEKNIFPKGLRVFVYNQKLDTIATISSDFAIQNKNKNLVEVKKNVVLKNDQNEQLNTEKLFWDKDKKQIYTDDFVTINTENEIIMGYGFLTDQTFSTYSLSNITGTIYL